MRSNIAYSRWTGAASAIVLGITLIAGLWPFHIPRNDVAWLTETNGIQLGHHGTLISEKAFAPNDLDRSSGTLEIWLEPEMSAGTKTILTFDGSAHPGEPFTIQQDHEALEIRRHNTDREGEDHTAMCSVGGVLRKGQRALVSITLPDRQTAVYVNGKEAKICSIAGGSENNFTGRMILANSTTVNNSWRGKIFGLVIYGRQLRTAEVAADYQAWTRNGTPELPPGEVPVAFYRFDEHAGSVAHNSIDAANNLDIPARYTVLHSAFLAPPWREYRARWSYWLDVGVNIGGFIPLGLCFSAYFGAVHQGKKTGRNGLAVVLLGFAVSFTIEVLQAWLPTRNSGTTDLFTNTLGTGMGVLLYRWSFTQEMISALANSGSVEPWRKQEFVSSAKTPDRVQSRA